MEQEQNRAPETPPAGAPAELPFGEPLLICPGLYRVRVPLPHNPLQALNSYIVLGDETTLASTTRHARRRLTRRWNPSGEPGTPSRSS